METALQSLWNGLPFFLIHSGASIAILIVGMVIYIRITAHDEVALIKQGNIAAALTFSGATIGLAIPLAFSLAASISLWDTVFWGIIALVLQLVAFRIVDLFLKDLSKRIESNEIGPAICLVSVKLSTAFINAAAISG